MNFECEILKKEKRKRKKKEKERERKKHAKNRTGCSLKMKRTKQNIEESKRSMLWRDNFSSWNS
jgi:hypothetical protein